MIINDTYRTFCPIGDTHKCRGESLQWKEGRAYYWAPEDYESFSKAFLRNEALVEAFIDPDKL